MQPHDGALRRFKQETRYVHQRSEGLRGQRGWVARAQSGALPAKDLTGVRQYSESTKENR